MENHTANHLNRVRDYAADNCIELLFQPAYSCDFNSQERVVAKIKLENRRLVNLDTDKVNEVKLQNLIQQAFNPVEVSAVFINSNRHYIAKMLHE